MDEQASRQAWACSALQVLLHYALNKEAVDQMVLEELALEASADVKVSEDVVDNEEDVKNEVDSAHAHVPFPPPLSLFALDRAFLRDDAAAKKESRIDKDEEEG
jgi:hypothetical protein